MRWHLSLTTRPVTPGSPVRHPLVPIQAGPQHRVNARPRSRQVIAHTTGLMFAGSVASGRSLITWFANDFSPLSPDVPRPTPHPWTVQMADDPSGAAQRGRRRVGPRGLLDRAGVVFVVTAAVAAWIATCSGVVMTVADSVTTGRYHTERHDRTTAPNHGLESDRGRS